jgi:hypothetical protein
VGSTIPSRPTTLRLRPHHLPRNAKQSPDGERRKKAESENDHEPEPHADGSLAERHDAHQHGAARARHPDAVAFDAAGALRGLIEPPRAPDLAAKRERSPELDADLRPRLRVPASVQHQEEHLDRDRAADHARGVISLL